MAASHRVDEAVLAVMRRLWRNNPVQTVLMVGQIRKTELGRLRA